MKFRMAPNSVFALLLRSPWWISFAVAVAVVAATQALLPADLRNIGSTAALPFVLIGCVAVWRQWRAPGRGEVQELLDSVGRMAWPEFEGRLREAFARQGHAVRPGQGGADLLLERQGQRLAVGARRWKAARQGEEALQPLAAAMQRLEAGRGLFVALGELSPQAQRFAAAHGIEILDRAGLAQLLLR